MMTRISSMTPLGDRLFLLTKGQLNGFFIFGVIPFSMMVGATYLAYIYLMYKILCARRVVYNSIVIILVIAFSAYYMMAGAEYFRLGIGVLGALNVSLALGFLLATPFLKVRMKLDDCLLTDIFIFIFIATCFFNILFPSVIGFNSYALLQIGSLNIAIYFILVKGWGRRLLFLFYVIASGGRSIIAGALYGLIMQNFPKIHRYVGWAFFWTSVGFLVSGAVMNLFQAFLQHLADNEVFLKGRTGFWLAVLGNEFTLFGNGAGSSSAAVYEKTGVFHQPHSEIVRVYSDYGSVTLAILCYVLMRNSLRNQFTLYSTSIFVAFMVTGNPLSFATATVCYLATLFSTREVSLAGK